MRRSGDNFLGGIATMLVIFVTLLPWALILLFVWWLFRKLRKRFPPTAGDAHQANDIG